MRKAVIFIIIISLISILFSCEEVLGPEPNGRWNPMDPGYVIDSDPVFQAGKVPVISITGPAEDSTPVQTKTWSWSSSVEGSEFRFIVNKNADFRFTDESFSPASETTQSDGDGKYYIHIQASTAEGEIGPQISASAILDNTAPSAPSNFTAVERYEKINLEWTNATEDFERVVIRSSTATFPAAIDDGDPVYSGSAGSYSNTGLTTGTGYYYSAYSVDAAGNASESSAKVFATPDILRTYAYVAEDANGLMVFDVTDPYTPTLKGSVATPGDASEIRLAGNYIYMADGSSGLQIIDIYDPENPVITGSCAVPVRAHQLVLDGSYAYLADYNNGLQIIDISSPQNPFIAGQCDGGGDGQGVFVTGSYAYITAQFGKVAIVDISTKTAPFIHSTSTESLSGFHDAEIKDSFVYFAVPSYGLRVVSLADPSAPEITATLNLDSEEYAICIEGNYAYLATFRDGGLDIVDISNPANPTLTGAYVTPGYAGGVAVSGSYAYIADNYTLQILDITNKANPAFVADYDTNGAGSSDCNDVVIGYND